MDRKQIEETILLTQEELQKLDQELSALWLKRTELLKKVESLKSALSEDGGLNKGDDL